MNPLDLEPHALDRPCRHPPGSAGKIETIARRYQDGLKLWHPRDWTQSDLSEIQEQRERLERISAAEPDDDWDDDFDLEPNAMGAIW